jgi:hypothetical protein
MSCKAPHAASCFPYGQNELHLHVCRGTVRHFDSKECCGEVCVLCDAVP